jgi:hypothetical protein
MEEYDSIGNPFIRLPDGSRNYLNPRHQYDYEHMLMEDQTLMEYYLNNGLEMYLDDMGYSYFITPDGLTWYPDIEAREFYQSFGDAFESISRQRQAISIPPELVQTCNQVRQYLQDKPQAKLILGAMVCKPRDYERFFSDPSFIFLDKRWGDTQEECKTTNRDIICDLNDPEQVEYLSHFFQNTFDKIITDLGVVKFLKKWTTFEVQCMYNMLKPNGYFILEPSGCSTHGSNRFKQVFDVHSGEFVDGTEEWLTAPGFVEFIEYGRELTKHSNTFGGLCVTPPVPRSDYKDSLQLINLQHIQRLVSQVFGSNNVKKVKYEPNNWNQYGFRLLIPKTLLFCQKS